MEFYINGKTIILQEGDSVYFDSSLPHGMMCIGDQAVRMLAVIIK